LAEQSAYDLYVDVLVYVQRYLAVIRDDESETGVANGFEGDGGKSAFLEEVEYCLPVFHLRNLPRLPSTFET
jgi:hypothetical protein